MLQELRQAVATATELVTEIGLRFKMGDPATGLLKRLESTLAILGRQSTAAVDLPDDLRAEITRLLSRVQDAVTAGDDWLDQTGPELASQLIQQRLRRAYGKT